MKFIKGYKLISQEELSKLETDAEVRGAKESKQRIDELKRSIEKKNGEIDHLRLVMGWDFYQELLRADNCYIRHGERDISMLGCRIVVNDSGFVSYLEVEL